MRVKTVSGKDVTPLLEDLGRLRIAVFREFPYLYEGSLDYEMRYLEHLAGSARALVVVVEEKGRLVGASTAMPLADEDDAFQAPFREQELEPSRFFYFAESVLLPEYRGRGLGRRFFEEREAHAASFGDYDSVCFCAVERPADHPARPAGYRPLDDFWNRLGFQKRPELSTRYSWQEVGEAHETPKPMTFWVKPL